MKPFSLFNICPKCEKQSPGTEAFSAEWEPKLTSYYPREDKRNHSERIKRTCPRCGFYWYEASLDYSPSLTLTDEEREVKFLGKGLAALKRQTENNLPPSIAEDLDLVCPHCGDDFKGHHSRVRLDLHLRKNHTEEKDLSKPLIEGKAPRLVSNNGCEYCNDEKWVHDDAGFGWWIENSQLFYEGADQNDIPISFCPFCGANLKENET